MKKPKPETAWPDATVWALDRIKPYERNPRTHPPAQIELLAKLIKQHGADQPIVVDDAGVILKGHGRLLAARAAGLKQFPVVQRLGLTEPDKQAMRISDNQVALLSGWDNKLIQGELGSLKLIGYDVGLLGFPEAQLRGWGVSIGPESGQDPEAIPDRPKNRSSRKATSGCSATTGCSAAIAPE